MTLPSKERQYVFQKGRKKGPSAVSRHPHEIHHNDDEHDGRLAGPLSALCRRGPVYRSSSPLRTCPRLQLCMIHRLAQCSFGLGTARDLVAAVQAAARRAGYGCLGKKQDCPGSCRSCLRTRPRGTPHAVACSLSSIGFRSPLSL